MNVSFTISAYQRYDNLRRGLKSLQHQLQPGDDVFVVEDGDSTNGYIKDICKEFGVAYDCFIGPKRYRRNSAIYNRQLSFADKDIVVFSGQDIVYAENFRQGIENILTGFGRGVLAIPFFETLDYGEHGFGSYHRYHETVPGWSTSGRDADCGCSAFWREDMQLFDEEFDLAGGYEGQYFGWEWLKKGNRIWCASRDEACVGHIMHEWIENPPDLIDHGRSLFLKKVTGK